MDENKAQSYKCCECGKSFSGGGYFYMAGVFARHCCSATCIMKDYEKRRLQRQAVRKHLGTE